MSSTKRPSDLTVLVVDPDELSRLIYGQGLRRLGLNVLYATDFQSAKDRILTQVPQVVISEVNLPDNEGFELFRLMRRQKRSFDIPIIYVCATHDAANKLLCLKLGIKEYYAKPITVEELYASIGRLIGSPLEAMGTVQSAIEGKLGRLHPFELVHILTQGRFSGKLIIEKIPSPQLGGDVNAPNKEAILFFSQGNVIEASFGELSAKRAFNRLMTVRDGTYRIEICDVFFTLPTWAQDQHAILRDGLIFCDAWDRLFEQMPDENAIVAVDQALLSKQEAVVEDIDDVISHIDGRTRLIDIVNKAAIEKNRSEIPIVESMSKLFFRGILYQDQKARGAVASRQEKTLEDHSLSTPNQNPNGKNLDSEGLPTRSQPDHSVRLERMISASQTSTDDLDDRHSPESTVANSAQDRRMKRVTQSYESLASEELEGQSVLLDSSTTIPTTQSGLFRIDGKLVSPKEIKRDRGSKSMTRMSRALRRVSKSATSNHISPDSNSTKKRSRSRTSHDKLSLKEMTWKSRRHQSGRPTTGRILNDAPTDSLSLPASGLDDTKQAKVKETSASTSGSRHIGKTHNRSDQKLSAAITTGELPVSGLLLKDENQLQTRIETTPGYKPTKDTPPTTSSRTRGDLTYPRHARAKRRPSQIWYRSSALHWLLLAALLLGGYVAYTNRDRFNLTGSFRGDTESLQSSDHSVSFGAEKSEDSKKLNDSVANVDIPVPEESTSGDAISADLQHVNTESVEEELEGTDQVDIDTGAKFSTRTLRPNRGRSRFMSRAEKHIWRGIQAFDQGQNDRANRALQRGLESRPDDWQALERLAIIRLEAGLTRQALHYADRAATKKPSAPYPALVRGIVAQQNGDLDSAMASFELFVSRCPTCSRVSVAKKRLAALKAATSKDASDTRP